MFYRDTPKVENWLWSRYTPRTALGALDQHGVHFNLTLKLPKDNPRHSPVFPPAALVEILQPGPGVEEHNAFIRLDPALLQQCLEGG